MAEYQAIETEYNGYRFRSRLEARWAIFFDLMNIRYQYETEGFICFNEIKYLPDFYFPDYEIYGEVKGTNKQLFEDQEKISAAIDYNSTPVSNGLLLLGPIPYPGDDLHKDYDIRGNYLHWEKGIALDSFAFQSAYEHGRILLMHSYAWDAQQYSSFPEIPQDSSVDFEIFKFTDFHPMLLDDALRESRSARFEFNEKK